jgi:hypothetical protein
MVAFAERLKEVRARGARIRSEAFVDYRPVVCGLTLEPVTLASYNRLVAFDNAFATGAAITMESVLVWIWIHHRDFGQHAVAQRRKVFRRAASSLRPWLPNLNLFLCLIATFPRFRWLAWCRRPTAQDLFADTVARIRHVMNEALAGFPSLAEDDHAIEPDDDGPKNARKKGYDGSAAVAFQAQLLNTFRRTYGMSYAETESLPLKKLAQLWREHLFVSLGDKTGLWMIDPEEAALWRDELADTQPEVTRG